jgi:serine/threonine protein kinase
VTVNGSEERRRYGEYEIETLLGKGSIGKVYLARHRRINRRVALKVIDSEQRFEDDSDRDEFYLRLQREAELCGALQHPNIVTLYEVGYENEVVSYLATEYVAGESLQARLKRTRPLPLREALSLAADILRGIAYAQARGIIHRDIKPANILISTEGMAKIADFGIARPQESSLTGINSLLGTPNYMSPEQVKSAPVSPRSDLFSAGVVMYEMLTGVRPFASAELSGVLFNVVNLDPPPVSDANSAVPVPVARIVARLMAKSPAERYAGATEALSELEALPPIVAADPVEYGTIAVSGDESTTPLPTIVDEPPPENGIINAAQNPIDGSNRTTVRTGVLPRFFTRDVPAAIFWPVTLSLLVIFAVTVLLLDSRIRQKPAAVITQEQSTLAEAKKHELAGARAFVAAAKYDEAIRRYDAFLARYPESVTAREERDDAQEMLDKSRKAGAEITSTAKSRSHRGAKAPTRKPSRWDRLKNWVRGQ